MLLVILSSEPLFSARGRGFHKICSKEGLLCRSKPVPHRIFSVTADRGALVCKGGFVAPWLRARKQEREKDMRVGLDARGS